MSSENDLPKICPVCGFDQLVDPPYDHENHPSFEICSCCGFEYGFDDTKGRHTFTDYRKLWIAKGAPFHNEDLKPAVWDKSAVDNQLKNTENLRYNL